MHVDKSEAPSGGTGRSSGRHLQRVALVGALSGAALAAALASPVLAQSNTPDGSKIYSSAGCSGCHGHSGNGGIGPRLSGNKELSDAHAVVEQILNGGKQMPPFKGQLSDAEIAAVATYIRTGLNGNHFGDVSEQQVAQAKSGQGGGNANAQSGDSDEKSGGGAAAQSDKEAQQASNDEGGGNKQDTMKVGAPAQNPKQPSTSGPDQAALDKAASATDSWLMYNKGYSAQRYSSLDQITAENASQIQPICTAQLGEQASFQTSPIVYDGLIYVTTPYSTYALDAKTCHQKWSYTYSPQGVEPFNTNRGVAIAGGRLFRGTSDGHFIALDAKTGDLLWNIRPVDSSQGYFLSSAPIVWHDMVFTGTAGADWGANGQMFAFNVKDGSTVWQFDEIKQDTFGSAEAAATGGGSNWTSYSLDPDSGLIYVPVGNPAPDFAAGYRPGKNLYTNSVIVLDAKSGKLDHYYQQIPNDPLDRDTAATPMLFNLKDKSGKSTHYTAVANKAGHMFVYDEDTQKQVYKVETTTLKNADTPPTQEGVHVCPGIDGGVEWYGPAYDPDNSTIYVGSVDWCTTFKLGEVRYTPGQLFFGGSYTMDPVDQAQGWIRAYDATDGSKKWQYQSELPVIAGVTPTAGGVLLTGELNGDFSVLDAKSGKKLYHYYTGGPIAAGVSTYEMDGQQYVAVASGNASRTWSPDSQPSATVFIFAIPQKAAKAADGNANG